MRDRISDSLKSLVTIIYTLIAAIAVHFSYYGIATFFSLWCIGQWTELTANRISKLK